MKRNRFRDCTKLLIDRKTICRYGKGHIVNMGECYYNVATRGIDIYCKRHRILLDKLNQKHNELKRRKKQNAKL